MEFVTEAVSDLSGVSIELPVVKLLVQNIILLLVPLAAGSLFRNLFPEAAVRVRKILRNGMQFLYVPYRKVQRCGKTHDSD